MNLVTNGSFEHYTARSLPIGPTSVLFTGARAVRSLIPVPTW